MKGNNSSNGMSIKVRELKIESYFQHRRNIVDIMYPRLQIASDIPIYKHTSNV